MAHKLERHQRRRPKQARSRATVEAIVEAAAQILERRGADALNTNDVAERAGVSIGTLYQYFSDKQALVLAAARRDLAPDAAPLPRRQRALIQALMAMLERLGRLGGGAAARPSTQAAATRIVPQRRRDPNASRESLKRVQDWLATTLASPQPVLRPLPFHRRLRE